MLDDAEASALKKVLECLIIKAGAKVTSQGEPSTGMWFIKKGQFTVSNSDGRKKKIALTTLGPGETIGELGILINQPRSADVEAKTDGQLYWLSREAFEKHIATHQGLLRYLVTATAERLKNISQRLAETALLGIPDRTLAALKSMATIDKETFEQETLRCRLPRHEELAAIIGTSREVVSRTLSLLEETNEIVREEKTVWILPKRAKRTKK